MEILSPQKHPNQSVIMGFLAIGKLRSEFTKPHARSFVFTDFHLVQKCKSQIQQSENPELFYCSLFGSLV